MEQNKNNLSVSYRLSASYKDTPAHNFFKDKIRDLLPVYIR